MNQNKAGERERREGERKIGYLPVIGIVEYAERKRTIWRGLCIYNCIGLVLVYIYSSHLLGGSINLLGQSL